MEHEDIWADILKRVPIKNVCRLRSVCKCWNSLISSCFFINLHLTCSATPPNLKPCFRVSSGPNRQCCYVLFHPTLDGIGVKDEDQRQQQLHFPIRAKVGSFDLVGIIHGVTCISYYSKSCKSLNTTLLWNPKVHKYIVLPYLSMRGDHPYYTTGFGYDKSTDDFKVVLFWIKQGKYQVFSSRQGEWGPLLTLSRFKSWNVHTTSRTTCFVNGTIHWVLSKYHPNYKNALLMFDCGTQQFRRRLKIIPKALVCSPPSLINFSFVINILEYGGCTLAALVRSPVSTGQVLHLWVMNNNGGAGGWDKVYTISQQCLYSNLDHDSNNDDDGISVHNPIYDQMGPFGTKNPLNKFRKHRFRNILSDYVYDETMFLMDHPNAHSYTDQDEIDIHSTSIIR